MPIGPSCAVADVTPDGAIVLCNTQDAYAMRDKLARVLGLPPSRIRVQYWEGASSFGNGPARFDTGEAAAVMSQLAGAPVRLQFMRWDEHGWDNYSPAVLADLRGGVDARGNIVALRLHRVRASRAMSMAVRRRRCQNVGIPLSPPGLGSADGAQLGHAVRHPEPARDRQVAAGLGHVLQDVGDARARTARRPASRRSS